MKIGVNLINFGPGVTPETMARWAERSESLGYHALLISDHVATTPDVNGRYPAPFYDPFTTLGWLAGITRRLELGTTVIVLPYRHALHVARLGANVDQLSGGRFILGVGVGWAKQEFDALGVPFNRRGALTDESLDVIRKFWATDVLTYTGRFVSCENVHTTPRPVRSPRPPIWIGGGSDAALRRAVRYGDAWHPIRLRLDGLRERLGQLRKIADGEQRPLPALAPRIKLRLTDAPMPDESRLAGEGTLDQIREDLAALEQLGATYVTLDTYLDDPEATRDNRPAWQLLETVAERALDLARGTVR